MKLLLDQGLPLSAATLLRDVGIDTVHVGEIGLSAAEDAQEESISKLKDAIDCFQEIYESETGIYNASISIKELDEFLTIV
jgi:Domain of unknown function (DUF5615)